MVPILIVPWRAATDRERLDVENGILLSPNNDALFDKNFISFDELGKIVFSPLLSEQEFNALGCARGDRISVTPGMLPFLKRHAESLRR